MKNKSYVYLSMLVISLLFNYGCQKEEYDFPLYECTTGTVIGYEECGEGTLIQLHDVNYGKTIEIYDLKTQKNIEYSNVVKSPGIYPKEKIYFIARKYDKESDSDLFVSDNPKPCQWLYGPYDVPIIVITVSSTTNCPY